MATLAVALAAFLVGVRVGAAASDERTAAGQGVEPQPLPRPTVTVTVTPKAENVAERETGKNHPEREPQPEEPEGRGSSHQGDDGGTRGPFVFVSRVIDGDTVEADLQGRTVDVRLIGVDTPETVHPSEPVGCYGPAASDFVTRQLEGRRVQLEFDVERRDQYGRTLAYIWKDGKLFNRVLVERGFAEVTLYPPDDKYEGRLRAAEDRAKRADNGAWGSCPYFGAPATGGADSGSDANDSVDAGGHCDPNYQGACIPPYPPDLDCSQVSASGFQSTGTDPHGFDGDADGTGCE
jgi:micrococcal nuclease